MPELKAFFVEGDRAFIKVSHYGKTYAGYLYPIRRDLVWVFSE